MRYSMIFGLMLAAMAIRAGAETITFFVGPDGNDAWSGRIAARNAQGSDGPFATLTHARNAVRAAKRGTGGQALSAIEVDVRAGVYFLDARLVLGPEDSGSPTCPITWTAYAGESPIVSGGRPIRQWEHGTLNGHAVWIAKLGDTAQGKRAFRELWVNGQRRQRARLPKKDYFEVAATLKEPGSSEYKGGHAFAFRGADLRAWPGAAGVGEVIVFNRWVESRLPIASIDEEKHHVTCGKAAVFELVPGDPYYIENVPETLSEPGEWCLDRSGTLWYCPMPGEEIGKADALAPNLTQLLRLEGDPAAGHFLDRLTFRGITFSHSEWYYDRDEGKEAAGLASASGFNQAAHGVAAAISARGAHGCVFDHCTVEHVGNYAVDLEAGCRDDRILGCRFMDLGGGGVKIGETELHGDSPLATFGNEVSNSVIADGGHLFASAIGVWIGQSHDNRILHNDIHGFYYTGISIGWTWGYGPAESGGNLIESNDIHHIGMHADGEKPVLSDMGGIYTLGNEKGTIIRLNRFHDIAGLRYGGWGIYFDEGTADILAENNLVYRTTHGGFHQHYGKNNQVRNNIFAMGRDMQLQRTRLEGHRSFTFEHNIVWWQSGPLLSGDWKRMETVFDHNTYWMADGREIRFAGRTFAHWQEGGEDQHSQIADPHFIAPRRGDFNFKEGPPAGFAPFDLSQVGPH